MMLVMLVVVAAVVVVGNGWGEQDYYDKNEG